jgi:hypothetical protein
MPISAEQVVKWFVFRLRMRVAYFQIRVAELGQHPHSCRGDLDVCVRPRVGAVYTIAAERAGGGVPADLGGLPQLSLTGRKECLLLARQYGNAYQFYMSLGGCLQVKETEADMKRPHTFNAW